MFTTSNWTGTKRHRIITEAVYQVSKCLALFALVMLAVTGIQYAQAQPIQVPTQSQTAGK